ncbi:hypothetical protein [Xanthobacter tagetidis]|uniref:Uncharacterized protein n=1 Tax=Xanthobacter tagetidis TaxID=60216 RepID=A0A3L7AJB9_9HYPH|nr:hypothetical protein [Xanthobacter tagetidis]MBB6306267.1 hypothetical protein [Xanthobacter tagetidis]RLP79542.1 hypothetical protein D9R14_07720 [Xanthobacter tagetidis]
MDGLLLISLLATFFAGFASCWAIASMHLRWLNGEVSAANDCIRAVRAGIRNGVKPLGLMRITEDYLSKHGALRPARIREIEGGSDA